MVSSELYIVVCDGLYLNIFFFLHFIWFSCLRECYLFLSWHIVTCFVAMWFSAIYLARGNHESKSMNKIYGFEGEVRSKLNETFVELFAEVFCCLPLAHVINEKVFVVHGGLFSVDGVKLSDIRSINRFCEPPEEG